jgi:hypothetical protein
VAVVLVEVDDLSVSLAHAISRFAVAQAGEATVPGVDIDQGEELAALVYPGISKSVCLP